MITILAAGTWGERYADQWWRPDSAFADMLRDAGATLAPEPFRWSTNLDGVVGQNREWERWGEALTWYVHKYSHGRKVNVIAHSHGDKPVAYALARTDPLRVNTLITVASPVRKDMLPVWAAGAPNLRRWVHIHTGWMDYWQIWGALGSGWRPWEIPREMPAPAVNANEPGRTHGSLLDPDLWRARGWAGMLAEKTAPPTSAPGRPG